jgi:hypothetical protein
MFSMTSAYVLPQFVKTRELKNTRAQAQKHESSKTRELKNTGAQKHGSSKTRELKNTGAQKHESSKI